MRLRGRAVDTRRIKSDVDKLIMHHETARFPRFSPHDEVRLVVKISIEITRVLEMWQIIFLSEARHYA